MSRMLALRRVVVILLFIAPFLASVPAQATHLRAGEITARRNSCSSLIFTITITAYVNTQSPIHFSDQNHGVLDFGDGDFINPPENRNPAGVPGFGSEYGYVSYSVEHVFPGPGQYTISYYEENRNGGILNMTNSIYTPFFIQTVINIDPFLGCDNSPRLLVPPLDKACTGAAWYHNPGAYDPDGDSLSYAMTIPKRNKGLDVNGYRPLTSEDFYTSVGIDYGHANEDHQGPPTFSLDPVTGTIIWDAPGASGLYNIAFLIIEWRKIGGVWIQMGYVTRDMQIEVEDCDNNRPELIVPDPLCVEAGTVIDKVIKGVDPDNDSVKMEAFSEVFSLNPSPATWSPQPPDFHSSVDTAKLLFHWATQCQHIKEQPYQVVFKITDNPPPGKGARLVQFQTWTIRVVGPAPKWASAVVPVGTRIADLKWDPYLCANAVSMQIWRRLNSYPQTHPDCVTGIPESWGYVKVDEIPIDSTHYIDNNGGRGLAPAAKYCYRLVAVFPSPGGGESYVSSEICLPPIPANAPIITNVSVDVTDIANGEISVKWRAPFLGQDTLGYHPPYPFKYEIFRAEGFNGSTKLTPVIPGKTVDTTVVDTGINTLETVFNYRIFAFDTLSNPIGQDSSASASAVRLEVKPHLKEIDLTWGADVPWSNQVVGYPMHLIYRGPEGSKESDLVLIDSVNVISLGLHYSDSGQYLHQPLKETDTYCYRVQTRGSYGNPKIQEPLINYSQIICAQPNDSIPPCKPVVKATGTDCSKNSLAVTCGLNTFSNTLTWNKPVEADCQADTRSYNIYVAPEVGAEFHLYQTGVRDTFFVDLNLPSFARCYKVTAVDRSGNESDLSEPFCFDNCPYYELPNVFTPNGDHCNELFSAYSMRYPIDENGNDNCGSVADDRKDRCVRFVDHVAFTVYNRWGKEVYSFESGGEESVYIDWDGKDNNGKDVDTGVYFYIANVTFDVVNPSERNKNIKGWVHLVR